MQDFAHRVKDILAAMANVLQPRNFDELAQYGLDGGEPPLETDFDATASAPQ